MAYSQEIDSNLQVSDTVPELKYPFKFNQKSSLYLSPSVEKEVIFDSDLGKYIIVEKIGDFYIKSPIFLSPRDRKSVV